MFVGFVSNIFLIFFKSLWSSSNQKHSRRIGGVRCGGPKDICLRTPRKSFQTIKVFVDHRERLFIFSIEGDILFLKGWDNAPVARMMWLLLKDRRPPE